MLAGVRDGMHSVNCGEKSVVQGRGLICVRWRRRLNGLPLMSLWCTSIKLNAALFDRQNHFLAILCSYITFNLCTRYYPHHRLMCLTSHWARKCINCYSKQRAILGALVQKIKHFSFSFFSLEDTMCCWTQPGLAVLDQKALFLGDFADRRTWPLLRKQQRFDEGLISEMAWWFSLLWQPYKAALLKSEVLFHMMSVHVRFYPLWSWRSGLMSFTICFPTGNPDVYKEQGLFFTTCKCCSSWSCIDFSLQNC